MFDWLTKLIDRIAGWFYRRGQGVVESVNRAREERVAAVRGVIDAIGDAMMHANDDREHGTPDSETASAAAATRAASTIHAVDDDEARRLVADWKSRFDAIPKGWKEQQSYSSRPPGYPEPAWGELREAARLAHDRLGVVLRGMLAEQ